MSLSTNISEQMPVLRRFTWWWRNWRNRRATVAELMSCGTDEVERVARDVGVSGAELCILAGKWPNSADLLNRRIEHLKLDAVDIARAKPQVIRDLQRVCTLCESKRRCARDLAKHPSDPVWQDYCPNTTTLGALIAERGRTDHLDPGAALDLGPHSGH